MNSLIIFVKNPVLGEVKTRIAQTVGHAKAVEVYSELLAYTRKMVDKITMPNLKINVFYGNEPPENEIFWAGFQIYQQSGDDLGERMLEAFKSVFSLNDSAKKTIIIGSDCFEIKAEYIEAAFNALDTHNIVIGPATDGGYYLLGMSQLYSFLFQKKSWSSDKLLHETLEDIQENNLSVYLLPKLSDIDTWDDYLSMNEMS